MHQAIVITPVKDSLKTTLQCAEAIQHSDIHVRHIIFNDFSTEETKKGLEEHKNKWNYELIHLENITQTPSPNYDLVLQYGQKMALEANLPLIVVESDVIVQKDTLSGMLNFYKNNKKIGMIGAVTVDKDGAVNYPYLKFAEEKADILNTKRSLSFCCTMFSNEFLSSYDFNQLKKDKDWYDTSISKKSLELGFENYLLKNIPVLHLPHSSRPWKFLKYKNPALYYLKKFFGGKDKI